MNPVSTPLTRTSYFRPTNLSYSDITFQNEYQNYLGVAMATPVEHAIDVLARQLVKEQYPDLSDNECVIDVVNEGLTFACYSCHVHSQRVMDTITKQMVLKINPDISKAKMIEVMKALKEKRLTKETVSEMMLLHECGQNGEDK